jgi:cytochrome c peroxidase
LRSTQEKFDSGKISTTIPSCLTTTRFPALHARIKTEADYGRYNVTKKEWNLYQFKVPTLRNVEKTFPYLHDGSANMSKREFGVIRDFSNSAMASVMKRIMTAYWAKLIFPTWFFI